MKGFGGEWTEKKIEILVEYAKAYLKITKVVWKIADRNSRAVNVLKGDEGMYVP